jgi:hypothetical protein
MTDDIDRTFELFLWGDRVHRAVTALRKVKLPAEVSLRTGPLGATLLFEPQLPTEIFRALVQRLEQERKAGLLFGLTVDKPCPASDVLDAWDSFQRRAGIPRDLTKRKSDHAPIDAMWVEVMLAALSTGG